MILHNKIVPAINQIETHPFHQQLATQQFLVENNVQIESWGPFAEGRNNLFTNEVLSGIGEKYNKSVAQVTLRWLIQRDVVVIPKSATRERIVENIAIFDFELGEEDMLQIAGLDKKESAFFDHRDPKIVKFIADWLNT